MSNSVSYTQAPAWPPHARQEMEGEPKPGIENTVDEAIYKIMVAQRREINRRNLPDLND